MQKTPGSIRNKLMIACAFVVACVLATPAAFAQARGHHDRRDHSADVIGALVVGAVIGGVLVSASQNHDRYYGNGYYYPQAYPPPPPPPGYYGNSGYYGYPGQGSVRIGVVYSPNDHRRYGRSYGYGRQPAYPIRHNGHYRRHGH